MSPASRADAPGRAGALLTPALLEGLGSLELVAAAVVRGFISGMHRSPFLGSGEDFARHRAYQQGDDVRRLDWRLYGRTDRLYVRLFEETSNLQAFLVVDASASMGFRGTGDVTKLRYGQFVAAALAHVMLRAGDAVGLASVGNGTRFHLPPRNRPGHLHDLLLALERVEPEGAGAASRALDDVGGVLRRRGRVVLISDALEDDDGGSLLGAVARLRARGDEVMVLRVATRAELGQAGGAPARYFDPERPDRAVSAAPESDPGFADRVAGYYDGLARGLREQGAEYVALDTDQDLVDALARWASVRVQGAAEARR